MYHNISFRQIDKILRKNGYTIVRNPPTNHTIYAKGNDTISIPGRGRSKDVNAMIIKRIFKEHNIKS